MEIGFEPQLIDKPENLMKMKYKIYTKQAIKERLQSLVKIKLINMI